MPGKASRGNLSKDLEDDQDFIIVLEGEEECSDQERGDGKSLDEFDD